MLNQANDNSEVTESIEVLTSRYRSNTNILNGFEGDLGVVKGRCRWRHL